jgi:eukaryotic-like serine/threonine-protein kinase
MSRTDWDAVRAAFEETVELAAPARLALLERELPDRPDLRDRVLRLLAAADSGEGPLDRTAVQLLEGAEPSIDEPAAAELLGRSVGGVLLTARLSSGGMGDVYLGERGVGSARRRVAVKVLRSGLSGASLLRRFRREQETLAALHHESIVSFIDAGTLQDDRPFVVMEHVEGEPITAWCRRHRADLRQRVALLRDVCAAVQFAHQNLVLHRDLKPGNILVTESGRPKLLDFGVAKWLQPEGEGPNTCAAPADATDVVRAPLTWRYASPEQLRGERVSVATDVYSLGLVLHELLCGRPAFGAEAAEARAALPPPSEAAADDELARGWRRRLRGDLDAIVLQALQPDPRSRYASVEALASDLSRWLEGLPVAAHRGTLAERAGKLLRRHRWPAAAAAALLLALAAGLLGTWLGKTRAEREASRGWGAHAQARAAAAFLGELLAQDALQDSAALDALDARVAAELGPWPESEALVRLALGDYALAHGRPDLAARNLERALSLERGLNPDDAERARELLAQARRPDSERR